MEKKTIYLSGYEELQIPIRIWQFDEENWIRQIRSDPFLPGDPEEVRGLIDGYLGIINRPAEENLLSGTREPRLALQELLPFKREGSSSAYDYDSEIRKALGKFHGEPLNAGCLEPLFRRIAVSLGNPFLEGNSIESGGRVAKEILDHFGVVDRKVIDELESDHFRVIASEYIESSPGVVDLMNSDQSIIVSLSAAFETLGYFEEAWDHLEDVFSMDEISLPVDIVFTDLGEYKGQTGPGWPIFLNAAYWSDSSKRGIWKPTTAHELFHHIQYSYGFSSKWSANDWFAEGIASWGEVFVWNRVSDQNKIFATFHNPNSPFDGYSYDALPLWIFFDLALEAPHGYCPEPVPKKGRVLEELFILAEEKGLDAAIREKIVSCGGLGVGINDIYSFFCLFCRERLSGGWSRGHCRDYLSIRAPEQSDEDSPLAPMPVMESGQKLAKAEWHNFGAFTLHSASCHYLAVDLPEKFLEAGVDGAIEIDFLRRHYQEVWISFVFFDAGGNAMRSLPLFDKVETGQSHNPPPRVVPTGAESLVLMVCALKQTEVFLFFKVRAAHVSS